MTTRTDRLVSIVSYLASLFMVFVVISLSIQLALAAIFGGIGPVEFVISVVIAIPLTIVLSRWVRKVLERRNRPAWETTKTRR